MLPVGLLGADLMRGTVKVPSILSALLSETFSTCDSCPRPSSAHYAFQTLFSAKKTLQNAVEQTGATVDPKAASSFLFEHERGKKA